jgi:hypothetical protein
VFGMAGLSLSEMTELSTPIVSTMGERASLRARVCFKILRRSCSAIRAGLVPGLDEF